MTSKHNSVSFIVERMLCYISCQQLCQIDCRLMIGHGLQDELPTFSSSMIEPPSMSVTGYGITLWNMSRFEIVLQARDSGRMFCARMGAYIIERFRCRVSR